jgi:nucleotide-binding universal stress UspA family protein
MKNILIPVDFSGFSVSATKTGAYIASKTGATVHLINITNAPEDWEKMSASEQKKHPEIEANIADALMKLKKFAEDPSYAISNLIMKVTGGSPYKQIIDYTEKHKIDLIVLGAHGAGDKEGLFVGSTAQKVLRTAACPVLSVKKDFNPYSLKKVLFASDFKEEGILKSFKHIRDFAVDTQAQIEFGFVNTPQHFLDSESIDARIKEFMIKESEIMSHSVVYNDYTEEEGILHIAKKMKPDVIALITHNRKDKKNYAFGLTEMILYHSDVPVLSQVM